MDHAEQVRGTHIRAACPLSPDEALAKAYLGNILQDLTRDHFKSVMAFTVAVMLMDHGWYSIGEVHHILQLAGYSPNAMKAVGPQRHRNTKFMSMAFCPTVNHVAGSYVYILGNLKRHHI